MAVSKDVAIAEVHKWLDFKKVDEAEYENLQTHIDKMIAAMERGYLVLNEDHSLTQKLKFPLEGELEIKELIFKPRVTEGTVMQYIQGVKTGDTDGRLVAYVCALTGKNSGIIKKLDTEDTRLGQNIAIFFM